MKRREGEGKREKGWCVRQGEWGGSWQILACVSLSIGTLMNRRALLPLRRTLDFPMSMRELSFMFVSPRYNVGVGVGEGCGYGAGYTENIGDEHSAKITRV